MILDIKSCLTLSLPQWIISSQVGRFAWLMLEEVSSKCLYTPINREEPVRDLANLCTAFLQASAVWGVWGLGTREGCMDPHCIVHCSRCQVSPSWSELSPAANPADLPSELSRLLLFVQDRLLKSRKREEGSCCLSPACRPGPGLDKIASHTQALPSIMRSHARRRPALMGDSFSPFSSLSPSVFYFNKFLSMYSFYLDVMSLLPACMYVYYICAWCL